MTKISMIAVLLLAGIAFAGTYTRPGGCRPGDIEIDRDCSAQNAAKAACENAHDGRVAAADVTLTAAVATCATLYLEKGYATPTACIAGATAVHRVAIQRSRRTLTRCLGRLPDCVYTCEEADPPPPPCDYSCASASLCHAWGGVWDASRGCCIH